MPVAAWIRSDPFPPHCRAEPRSEDPVDLADRRRRHRRAPVRWALDDHTTSSRQLGNQGTDPRSGPDQRSRPARSCRQRPLLTGARCWLVVGTFPSPAPSCWPFSSSRSPGQGGPRPPGGRGLPRLVSSSILRPLQRLAEGGYPDGSGRPVVDRLSRRGREAKRAAAVKGSRR